MAIKGKKKPKARPPRVVTRGPRPAYVTPKVPLFQRTGAKFTVALVAEAIIFSLLIGFGEQSETTRQQERISEFTTLIDASLSSAGDAVQPFPGGAQVLPGLPSRLGQLESGELGDEVAIPEAEGWASSLTQAADGVSAVQVPSEDLDPAQSLALNEARALMDRGLRMFVGIANEFRVAVQITGDSQGELIAVIQEQLTVASEIFNAGYSKLQDARSAVGLPPPASPTSGGLPGGGLPGGGLPGGGLPGGGLPGGGLPVEGIPGAPPGFDPTQPGGTEEIPEVPVEGEGGGGGGGNNGGGGGGGGGNG